MSTIPTSHLDEVTPVLFRCMSTFKNYGVLVRHLGRCFTRKLQDDIDPFDVSAGEFRVLLEINAGSTMQDQIAQNAAMDRPFVTVLIKKLKQKRIISTRQNGIDRRRVDLRLTARGKRLVENVLQSIIIPTNMEAVRGIPQKHLEIFESVVRRMIDNLGGSP